MNFLAKESVDRWYKLAWWFYVITLPWNITANNISLILLSLVWITKGNFLEKWQKLKWSTWVWPFLIYYTILVIGLIYTLDFNNGLFNLDRKISFFVLPLISATGRRLDENFIALLKRSFIYSCSTVILVCLTLGIFYFFSERPIENFDFSTYENFTAIHPNASILWMHFSYIQIAQWAGILPAYLSMYLIFCLVLIFTMDYSDSVQRNIHLSLAFLIASFIALLSTRMAILAFVGSAIYLTARKFLEKGRKEVLAVVFISFILLFLVWLNPVSRFRVLEEPRITTYQADRTVTNWNSVSYRLLEWQATWSVIRSNWLTGVGTGGWKIAVDKFYDNYNRSTIGLGHNAHNQYLQAWMENGLFGLFTFSACLWAGLLRLYKDPSYVAFILIFSLMCLTESISERQKGVVFFTLFQVLYLGFPKRRE